MARHTHRDLERWSIALGLLFLAMDGCSEHRQAPLKDREASATDERSQRKQEPEPRDPARKREVQQSRHEPSATSRAAEAPPETPAKSQPRPHRPIDTWVIFRTAFDDSKDATYDAAWIEKNHFQIKTQNIERMTIDLTQLPLDAPRRPPWIFHVDGQGIELYGSSTGGYSGMRRDLIRSRNGKWTIDKGRLNRIGSQP